MLQQYPFIFSDEPRYRLRRHFLFWFCWWVFQSFLYSFSASVLQVKYITRLPSSALEAFLFLVPHMFLAYSLMYFVIPKLLLRGKYIASAATVLLLFLATGFISSVIGMYVVQYFRARFYGDIGVRSHVYMTDLFLGLLAGLRGAITIGGMAAAIRLMKFLYMKEQRNMQLQKENISAQLQILKAQIHPHFLFNTLNNIYSFARSGAPAAAGMIMNLSDMLRYILYEGARPFVALDKELYMLRQYILLEEARYGNKLDMTVEMPGEGTSELQIAPLILLPFVENCFKHGASHMLDQPWVQLNISLEKNWLKMKLVNGKPAQLPSGSGGIGLANARKRLELLYPGRHVLTINNEEEVFIVNLKLELHKSNITVIHSVAQQNLPQYG